METTYMQRSFFPLLGSVKAPKLQFANSRHRMSNQRRNIVRNDCWLMRSNCLMLPVVTSTPVCSPNLVHPNAYTERVSCQSNQHTSLERPALHPEFREGGPGVVEGRVGHDGAARSLSDSHWGYCMIAQ